MIRLISLLLFIVLPVLSYGQQKTLLYSVKGKNAQLSYLFGTVHLIADSAFYFPGKLDKALQRTDKLVLELNSLADQEKAQQLMVLDSGSMFDIFPPEQADSVVYWGASLLKMKPEVFIEGFKGMKPFVLVQIAAQKMLQPPVKSYEWELIAKANANKQPILGLETMEYQIGLFDAMPDSVMAEMIMDGIRHPEEAVRVQREMTRLYEEQDVEGLARLITESGEFAESAETLVFRRNRNWIPVMEQYMQNSSCFFAVGAGHLGGEQGVIQLLRNAGYIVTPIPY
jgi:uncharacterized protein